MDARWLKVAAFVAIAVVVLAFLRDRQREEAIEERGERIDEALRLATPKPQRQYAHELHRNGKHELAVAAYDEALKGAPDDAEALYWRGMSHWKLGHLDAALRDFRRVTELEPGNRDAYRGADRVLSGQMRYDEAIRLWSDYLAAVPRDGEGFYERGGASYRKGDIPAALADATRACELGYAQACAIAERLRSR